MGGRRGDDDLIERGAFLAVSDVVADRTGEEPAVLEHHAERAPDSVARQLARIGPIEADGTTVDVVEAHEEIDDRGLPCAGRPDDRDSLARSHVEREVLDERPIRQVAEGDAVELDVTARRPGCRCADPVRRLFGRAEELEHALRRCEP